MKNKSGTAWFQLQICIKIKDDRINVMLSRIEKRWRRLWHNNILQQEDK